MCTVELHGLTVEALADTGADCCVIGPNLYKNIPEENKLGYRGVSEFSKCLGATGHDLAPRGEVHLTFKLDGRPYDFPFTVVENLQQDLILGADFMKHYRGGVSLEDMHMKLGDHLVPLTPRFLRTTDPSAHPVLSEEGDYGFRPGAVSIPLHIGGVATQVEGYECQLESEVDDTREELLRLLQDTHRSLLECRCRERDHTDASGRADDTGDHPPFHGEPYQAPHRQGKAADDAVEEMLANGVIEPAKSPWSSPLVLPRRPDSDEEFRVNSLGLNSPGSWDDESEDLTEDEFSHEQYFLQHMYGDASMRYMMGELQIQSIRPEFPIRPGTAVDGHSWWEESEDEYDHQMDEGPEDEHSSALPEGAMDDDDLPEAPEFRGDHRQADAWVPSSSGPYPEEIDEDHWHPAIEESEEYYPLLELEESDDDW